MNQQILLNCIVKKKAIKQYTTDYNWKNEGGSDGTCSQDFLIYKIFQMKTFSNLKNEYLLTIIR